MQTADKPGAGVGQRLVVEIHRVLRRQDETQAVSTCLLEQSEEQFLAGRIRGGRQIAKHLVHVEDCAQARRALLRAHPADDLRQQHRNEEHALVVAEVRNRQDRHARLARVGVEQALRVERLALHPRGEAGRGQQVVNLHREAEAILLRIEGLEIHHADAGDRRALNSRDQRGEIEVAAGAPFVIEDLRYQDVLAAGQRIRVFPEQGQHAGGRRLDALAVQIGVVHYRAVRRGKRIQHRYRRDRRAPRRVHPKLRGVLEGFDALAVLPPAGQPFLPERGLGTGVLIQRLAGVRRRARVHPRTKLVGGQPGKRQQDIRHVPFRINGNHRDAVERRLLKHADAEPGLARAGHADDHGVGREVLGVVENEIVSLFAAGLIDAPAEEQRPQLLEIVHSDSRLPFHLLAAF